METNHIANETIWVTRIEAHSMDLFSDKTAVWTCSHIGQSGGPNGCLQIL